MASTNQPVLVQWLVDTRRLWPAATQTKQLPTVCPRALAALLSDEERAGVLRYFSVRDAKMALASQLLKHRVVARCAGVAWRQTVLGRGANGKPVYAGAYAGACAGAEDGGGERPQPVVFNVSHQAGLVALAAVYYPRGRERGRQRSAHAFEVGIDVVAPTERRTRDHQMIRQEGRTARDATADGWARFVDMHADVLAADEVRYLQRGLPAAAAADTDARLRYFYALWCLREAYVKMTGEALLAPWLRDLAFCRFQPSARAGEEDEDEEKDVNTDADADADSLTQGPPVTTHDIRLRGVSVGGEANVCLRSVGADYMVCVAVRARSEGADGADGRDGTDDLRKAALALPTTAAFEVLSLEDMLADVEDV